MPEQHPPNLQGVRDTIFPLQFSQMPDHPFKASIDHRQLFMKLGSTFVILRTDDSILGDSQLTKFGTIYVVPGGGDLRNLSFPSPPLPATRLSFSTIKPNIDVSSRNSANASVFSNGPHITVTSASLLRCDSASIHRCPAAAESISRQGRRPHGQARWSLQQLCRAKCTG